MTSDLTGVTMRRIVLLLFFLGSPVNCQFTEYGDYGQFMSGNTEEARANSPDSSPLRQQSFFKSDNQVGSDSLRTTTISSLMGDPKVYGGLTPPPPLEESDLQVNEDSRTRYFTNERIPSSLRELEESYIRSLSAPTPPTYDETTTTGVENYSGFLTGSRRQSESRSISSKEQRRLQHLIQNAPITYGLPLVGEHGSTNFLTGGEQRKKEKFYNFFQKNHFVRNYHDYDRPPVPEEPDSPPGSDAEEEATRKPPPRLLLPTPQKLKSFGLIPPLSSPPRVFDPDFPEPVLERGFIPSFGPPTKLPFNQPLKETQEDLLLDHNEEPENNHLQLQSHRHITTSQLKHPPPPSSVPVLRPEYSNEKEAQEDKPEGKVFKHISVHVGPEDLDDDISAPKIVKIAKPPEKHIKVIFIKPPDTATPKTEVEVAASPPQKTLVYVLSESGGTRQPIRLVTPTPLKPAPPQVFFLRYTDGRHRQPSGPGSTKAHPIKQIAQEQLIQAPTPVVPTFTSFGHPSSTLLQSPTLYPLTNFETTNAITNDPTNSKFQASTPQATATPPALHPNIYRFQPSQQINNAFYQQPLYSSLYHLYPPPQLTAYQFPYYNPYQNLQQQQALQPQRYYLSGPTKLTGSSEKDSDIKLSDINFNSLLQNLNKDGRSLHRTTRNYAMMTYAPTYMPNAQGSDHVPVFTSPADLIKSLLGDSYYFNDIGNSSITSPSTPPILQTNLSEPITITISNGGKSYEIDSAGHQNQLYPSPSPLTPINPHLVPNFLKTAPTSTTPPPRISWAPSTYHPPVLDPTGKQIINLPLIIYEGSSGKNTRFRKTHRTDNLFNITQSDSASEEQSGEQIYSFESFKTNSTSPKSRKRVNPAFVKPGRRLRKVRKPNRSIKSEESKSS